MPALRQAGPKRRTRGQSTGNNRFRAGVKIFSEDRPSSRIYQLRSGRVQISRRNETILDYLVAHDFFGEETLLDRKRRVQTAKAVTPVSVTTFRVSDLLDRVQRDRRFTLQLLKNLARRLDGRGVMIHDFVTEPAERRLARLLFRLTPGPGSSGWARLRFSPSNSEMARTVGTTRGRIMYFIGLFRRIGWLDRRPELWVHREGIREYLRYA